jgi:hypothetical protein
MKRSHNGVAASSVTLTNTDKVLSAYKRDAVGASPEAVNDIRRAVSIL